MLELEGSLRSCWRLWRVKRGYPVWGSYHYTRLWTFSTGNIKAYPLQSYPRFSFLHSPVFITTSILFPKTLLSSNVMALFSQNLNSLLEFSFFPSFRSRFVSFNLPLLLHLFSPATVLSTALWKADWKTFCAIMWAWGACVECEKGTELGVRKPESQPWFHH